jgi:hypothetical protein
LRRKSRLSAGANTNPTCWRAERQSNIHARHVAKCGRVKVARPPAARHLSRLLEGKANIKAQRIAGGQPAEAVCLAPLQTAQAVRRVGLRLDRDRIEAAWARRHDANALLGSCAEQRADANLGPVQLDRRIAIWEPGRIEVLGHGAQAPEVECAGDIGELTDRIGVRGENSGCVDTHLHGAPEPRVEPKPARHRCRRQVRQRELPGGIADYVDRLVAPYFGAVAEWYAALRIGQTGGTLHDIVTRRLGDPFFGISLNPGHQIHLDEWVNSPIYASSTAELRSGMALQADIIPATGTDYFTTNVEDGIALADEPLRVRFADAYPGAWRRIGARRRFMAESLGVELHPDVLPFSNIPAFLPPFLLRPDRVMTMAR